MDVLWNSLGWGRNAQGTSFLPACCPPVWAGPWGGYVTFSGDAEPCEPLVQALWGEALVPHLLLAILNLLVQVWERSLYVQGISGDSPDARPEYPPACQTLSSKFWFPKNGLVVKSAWPVIVYAKVLKKCHCAQELQ